MALQKEINKTKKQLYCAVCMTTFSSKQSMKKHILNKGHSMTTCSNIPTTLKEMLPSENFFSSKFEKLENGYIAEIYLPTVGTRELLHSWMDTFMQMNGCKYVRSRSSVNSTACIIAQEHYLCEHHWPPNPLKRKKVSKGTNCKSSVYAVLKKSLHNIAWLKINFVHNHSFTSPAILRFKKPTEKIKQIFLKMFEDGATPAEALRYFRIHVRTQLTEKEFLQYSTDRSKVPDYDWVRHYFYKTVKKKYSSTKPPEFMESARHTAKEWNTKTESICSFTELTESDFFVVIMTPLMKRVLQTSQAGNFMLIDHCGNIESFGLKVFLLFTELNGSEAPISIIVTTKETTPSLVRAFGSFLSLTDLDAFGGKGNKGPNIVFTDDNQSEISAVRNVFSSSSDLICITHFLSVCHKWLLKPKNEVGANDRKNIFSLVRQMIYASDERKFSDYFTTLTQSYENHLPLKRFARQIFEKRKRWAMCFRTDPVIHIETFVVNFEVRILKEQILDKIKNQSCSDLIHYIINDFSEFYEQKFLDYCYSNVRYFKTKELTKEDLTNYAIIQVSDSLYVVYNKIKNIKYMINADIGVCTCYIGTSGNYCKHQQLLSKNKKAFYNPIMYSQDKKSKTGFYYVATGNINIPENIQVIDEVIEIESCNIIEEVTEEVIENDSIDNLDDVLENKVNHELIELSNHVNDICFEIESRNDFYLKALRSFNEEISSVKNTPEVLLEAMFSFNCDKI